MLDQFCDARAVDRAKGCLLGGAIGDALGAPIEFHSWQEIENKFGPNGLQEFAPQYGEIGKFTDDTQMTLFSAEGLIRAMVKASVCGDYEPTPIVGMAYQRWLHTQGQSCDPAALEAGREGWLVTVPGLFKSRAPGLTCLSALEEMAVRPGMLKALNGSKGCGTVMRSAPFGFFPEPWQTAWECAAITWPYRSPSLGRDIGSYNF